jgi:hypothetical protein
MALPEWSGARTKAGPLVMVKIAGGLDRAQRRGLASPQPSCSWRIRDSGPAATAAGQGSGRHADERSMFDINAKN